MIDLDWLQNLSFECQGDLVVSGLFGVGSESIVLRATAPDGRELALKTPKLQLGFHINEVPPALCARPLYNIHVLNEKLANLVGMSRFDRYSYWYNKLYAYLISFTEKHDVPAIVFSNMSLDSVETIPFIVNTRPFVERLEEIAHWPVDPDDPSTMMPTVNGTDYPIHLLIVDGEVRWAVEALQALRRLPEQNPEFSASTVFNNPLVVWGAATLEGFFTDDDLSVAAEFIEERFGHLSEREDVVALIGQANSIASLIAQYLPEADVQPFVRLCAKCDIVFQVHDRDGDLVADGFAF